MKDRCPFCWDKNIKQVSRAGDKTRDGKPGRLMRCSDCEKWYWTDSGEELTRLYLACETGVLHPGRCCPEILGILHSGGNGFPRRRLAEFNFLCSECPDRKFRPMAHFDRKPERMVGDTLGFGV